MIAPGSNDDFHFTVGTTNPDGVWDLWTKPSTWQNWDKGLKSASLDGPMVVGSVGQLIPVSGPATTFTVVALQPRHSYAFETRLPGSTLRVERAFSKDRTAFTHRVKFSGLSAFLFARILGPGFRMALPHTMAKLRTLAEA